MAAAKKKARKTRAPTHRSRIRSAEAKARAFTRKADRAAKAAQKWETKAATARNAETIARNEAAAFQALAATLRTQS